MRHSGLGLLGFGALCAAAMSASAVGGCQASGNGPPPGGSTGSGGESSTSTGEGGASTSSSGTGTAGGGGTGGSLPVVTIQDITNDPMAANPVGEGIDVEVHGVIAMSRKYLVSKSKNTGSCLWGVFLSAPGHTETQHYSGLLAVSYGTPGVLDPNNNLLCPKLEEGPVGDAFPDDVKPGDVLDVRGETSYFLLSQCATQPADQLPSQVKQRQLAKVDLVTRTGTAPVPAPHTVTAEELSKLNSPTDQAFHDEWGGVKVRIPAPVTPALQGPAGMETVVGPYANIYIDLNADGVQDPNDLRVGDKVYWERNAISECHNGPIFANISVEWNRIDGFSSIDFCTWSLQPTNKCLDFDPPSDDCVAGLMCPE